jgi:pyruvate dehydrogenase E2 component (dihydrolipoamide acetyltransferase)
MHTPLLMPSLSPTMEEGTIARWFVKTGDLVQSGTTLCSIETDKTTVDYDSLDEGYLREILVPEGQSTKVNNLIAILTETADEPYEVPSAEVAPAPSKKESASSPAPAESTAKSASSAPAKEAKAAAESGSDRVKATPLARKLAAEKGLNLSAVTGSGPSGRIVKTDVENAPVTPATPKGTSKTTPRPEVQVNVASEEALFGGLAAIPADKDIPVSKMMGVIGQRLKDSWLNSPAFFVTMKMLAGPLQELRKNLNSAPGYKITVNDLVLKAVAMNLRQFPRVNSSFLGDRIRENGSVDISVAVSLPEGLITPIVRQADLKTIGQISAEIKELGKKAKAGTLAPEEYQGGTFSVSNMGMYGVHSFTSIINPPQSAILAVAGMEEELYRKEDGTIDTRQVMNMTLTADHRVINGALAAEFMAELKKKIENPSWFML